MTGRATRSGEVPVYFDATPITHTEAHMQMSDAEALVGDGKAEVVVSHDMSDKDFGNGTSTFCSVKLTVNQDEQSILAGVELASALVLEQMPALRAAANAVWDPPPPPPREPRGRERR